VLGGAPFNFAFRINALGDKGLFVSRLGRDLLGQQAHEQLLGAGIDPSLIQWDEHHPTGAVKVSFDALHNPDYVIIPDVAYDYVEMTKAISTAAANAECTCFGTLAQRSERSRSTLAQILESADKSVKFLDINLRKKCFDKETINWSLQAANILKLNEAEVYHLSEIIDIKYESIPAFCDKIMDTLNIGICLVTLAEYGVFATSAKGEMIYCPGYSIALADSLGAGDAFSAGFVHRYLRGVSLKTACDFGNILGALASSKTGATAQISEIEISSFSEKISKRNVLPALERYII
jgi:fructokinase